MPKLIATDIDGTLLQNGELVIREAFFREAHRLMEQGIAVCAASGRQYSSLRRLFAPIADDIYYICENGAVVFGKGKLLAKSVIERHAALELCRDILAQPGCEILISGTNMSYICPKEAAYISLIRDGLGNNTTVLASPEEMPEDFLKISVYCPDGTSRPEQALKPRWENRFQIAVAGQAWLDFNCCDKGDGLRALCGALEISCKDAMVFGDNYNDCPMLDLAGQAYLMTSAAEPLRKRYPRQCARVEEVLASL